MFFNKCLTVEELKREFHRLALRHGEVERGVVLILDLSACSDPRGGRIKRVKKYPHVTIRNWSIIFQEVSSKSSLRPQKKPPDFQVVISGCDYNRPGSQRFSKLTDRLFRIDKS